MFKKGFTLIELLVVIAVIAVLATAVIASINPIEQINKAKDTAAKSDASEFLKAAERYYATFQCYPWEAAATTGNCPATPSTQSLPSATYIGYMGTGTSTTGGVTGAIALMENRQELKTNFKARVSGTTDATVPATPPANALIAYTDGSNLVHVCFKPSSNTFKVYPNANFTDYTASTAGSGTTCTTSTTCYVCVP